jgi:hypothetical protein
MFDKPKTLPELLSEIHSLLFRSPAPERKEGVGPCDQLIIRGDR